MTEGVLRELATDSKSDMEPEDYLFLLVSDDFVTEKCWWRHVAWIHMMYEYIFFLNSLESLYLHTFPPFQQGCFTVTMTMVPSIKPKRTTECKPSTHNVSSQSIHKQTHNASLNSTTMLVRTSLGSLKPALQQLSGCAVQKGLSLSPSPVSYTHLTLPTITKV